MIVCKIKILHLKKTNVRRDKLLILFYSADPPTSIHWFLVEDNDMIRTIINISTGLNHIHQTYTQNQQRVQLFLSNFFDIDM